MRSIVMACAGMLVPITTGVAATSPVSGSVVAHFETCDHFVVQTTTQYVLLQWSSGTRPGLKTVITGSLDHTSRAPQPVQLDQSSQTSDVWIEAVFPQSTLSLSEIKDPCQCQ